MRKEDVPIKIESGAGSSDYHRYMSPTDYRDGIQATYEGELIGENLYRILASGSARADVREKLDAIADVEGLTHKRLEHIAVRLGISAVNADWWPTVERRASILRALNWPEFISSALHNWPPYVERFRSLLRIAPSCDESSIKFLIRHEVALVTFAQLEHVAMGSGASLQALHHFIRCAERD